jgi:hypothetical protein
VIDHADIEWVFLQQDVLPSIVETGVIAETVKQPTRRALATDGERQATTDAAGK